MAKVSLEALLEVSQLLKVKIPKDAPQTSAAFPRSKFQKMHLKVPQLRVVLRDAEGDAHIARLHVPRRLVVPAIEFVAV